MSFSEDKTGDLESSTNVSISLEGSVVASPSIESFSTLPEGEASLNLCEDQDRDLAVRVDNPQKHFDLLDTYVTFRVSTRTTREDYQPGQDFSVRRRYNDFVWLRQSLTDAFPTHFIPPLPVKHSIIGQLDRYGREFVTARMTALHLFMTRVVQHSILSFAPCLKCFLTCTTEELQQLRKLSAPGLLSKVSSSIQSLTTLHLEPDRPADLEKVDHTLNSLSDKLNHVLKISQRIHKERTDGLSDVSELKTVLQGWAGTESDLTDDLCELASAVDKARLSVQTILLDAENCILTQPLKEYLLYVDAVKEALARRDLVDLHYQMMAESLEKKTLEKAELEGNVESTVLGLRGRGRDGRAEKLEKLEKQIPGHQRLLEDAKDKLVCANENIRADLESWNVDRKNDMKAVLATFADQHINHYEQCLKAWSDVQEHLQVECNGNTS